MTMPPHLPQKKRRERLARLLRRLRPQSLPVTWRHNRVVLFSDGERFFRTLFAAIRSARHAVLLEYYIIRNDRTGAVFAEELAAAAHRGVRVVLIYDYIGCLETPAAYFKTLEQQGVLLLPFNIPSFRRGVGWFDKRDHRKMAIIDGSLALLGGINIADEYAGLSEEHRRFRDMGFSICGTAVQELVLLFRETWLLEKNQALPLGELRDAHPERHHGKAGISLVSGGPHQRSSYIRNAFLVNIAASSEELLIVSPYFVPGPRIIRGLLRAARRGVRVRLLLPARSDVPLVRLVGRSFYGTLLAGGIEIYELEREILHAKVMLVDRERTLIGSANLDQRSFHRNFEINAVIDSADFGDQIRTMLEQDFAASRRITIVDHERRGLTTRLLEKIVSLFAWFL